MQQREIKFLSKGLPKSSVYKGKAYRSGIWKDQVNELFAGFQRIADDDVDNHINHGGADREVCVYPFEHYGFWEREFGTSLTAAAFGENLTVTNMTEDQVCIGDIYQRGEATVQVSQGRYPCATINKRNQNDLLLKRIIETGYTGYFFRVLKEGRIDFQAKIETIFTHSSKVTVAAIHRLYFHESPTDEAIRQLLEIEELAASWREKLQALL